MSARDLSRVVSYIETHLSERITVQVLAKLINMNVGRLFRTFKQSVGVTPIRYITARRVQLICTLLIATREPLSQVALACGLSDQAHLCKVFRRAMGASPSHWRRAMTTATRLADARAQDMGFPDKQVSLKVF